MEDDKGADATNWLEASTDTDVEHSNDCADGWREWDTRSSEESGATQIEQVGSGGSVDWRERPLSEFRSEYPGQYIESTDTQSVQIEPFRDPREWVDSINPQHEVENAGPYSTNCVDCSRAVERTWRGHVEQAAGKVPELRGDGDKWVQGEFPIRADKWTGAPEAMPPSDIHDRLETAGPGASGIVEVSGTDAEGNEFGHALNIVNYEGKILAVDGQHGLVEQFNPLWVDSMFRKLDTHTEAVIWEPDGTRV